MRALLVAALLVSAGQAFGACATSMMTGSWNVGANGKFCSIYTMKNGSGSGPCSVYYPDGSYAGLDTISVAVTVDAVCVVNGLVDGRPFLGKLDWHNPLMVEGIVTGLGAVIMLRP